ncbi:MAG TPA: DUF58 domain-containing protein [Anaerolineae bacterium]|nr:DUF58 domain-containing protein [Anaerolineae bacterium]
MSRFFLLVSLVYALLLAGLGTLNAHIMVLAVPPLLYVGLSLLRANQSLAIRCRRVLNRDTVREGDEVQVILTVTNEGEELERVEVLDPVAELYPVIEGETSALAALLPGEVLKLQYTIRGQRGAISLPPVQVRGGETLGISPRWEAQETKTKLMVLPDYPHVRRVSVRPLHTLGFTGPIPARRPGSGTDFYGVRNYQPGDPLRRIHWRATARHVDVPFTTEFEQERIANIGIILDTRPEQMQESGDRALFEHGVRAAAALADALLRDGHRVGLLLYGLGTWVFPGYGKVQRERILRALASSEPSTSKAYWTLAQFPTRFFPARSQLLFISSLRAEDEATLLRLRAFGYSVLVVSPDPIAFRAENLPEDPLLHLAVRLARIERLLLLRRLRQGGVIPIHWSVSQNLDQVVASTLLRNQPMRQIRERF